MGAVYKAYDPELDRGVALKLMHLDRDVDLGSHTRREARLIREAKALAKLAHPNIVAIHDAGSFGDQVFLAMELIEGKTLQQWYDDDRPSQDEILSVMFEAGKGLHAAHTAGLIHRDFKPSNVILGIDKRVRVIDFGLVKVGRKPNVLAQRLDAASSQSTSDPPRRFQDSSSHSRSSQPPSTGPDNRVLFNTTLTHDGVSVGTPRYMAPEQHLEHDVDARSDQYSFCMVLYELLFQQRPFQASNRNDLVWAMLYGEIPQPPESISIKPHINQAIRKGLAADPDKRYASMSELLVDLQHDPQEIRKQRRTKRRRFWMSLSLMIVVAIVPFGLWWVLRPAGGELCKTPNDYHQVWSQKNQQTIRQAMTQSGQNQPTQAWPKVSHILGRYSQELHQMHRAICQATHVEQSQSQAVYVLRTLCLNQRLREFQALIEVLGRADKKITQNALKASHELTPVAQCADEQTLVSRTTRITLPKDEKTRLEVERIQVQLAQAKAYSLTGKYQQGLRVAEQALEASQQTSYQPMQAQALYWVGKIQMRLRDNQSAYQSLLAGYITAMESDYTELQIDTATLLVFLVGYFMAQPDQAEEWSRFALALLTRIKADDLRWAFWYRTQAAIDQSRSLYDKAAQNTEKSLARMQAVLGTNHPEVAMTQNNLAAIYAASGKQDQAIRIYNQSIATMKETLGENHPNLALPLHGLALAYKRLGNLKQAHKFLKRTLAIQNQHLPKNHPAIAETLLSLGEVQRELGELQKAMHTHEWARAIIERTYRPDHPLNANLLWGIGEVQLAMREYKKAMVNLEKALRICETQPCDKNAKQNMRFSLAQALQQQGERSRALSLVKLIHADSLNDVELKQKVELWLSRQKSSNPIK